MTLAEALAKLAEIEPTRCIPVSQGALYRLVLNSSGNPSEMESLVVANPSQRALACLDRVVLQAAESRGWAVDALQGGSGEFSAVARPSTAHFGAFSIPDSVNWADDIAIARLIAYMVAVQAKKQEADHVGLA